MKLSKILFPLCLIAAFSIECSSGSDSTDNPSDTPQPTPEPTQTDTTSSKPEPPVVDLDSCELASYSLFVDCMGGEEVITVKSNRTYTVVSTVDWITVKDSRAVTESEVTIQITENTDAEREGIVEFVMNDTQEPTTLQFVVKQAAAGVVFEDKTVNDAINDMDNSIWHPNEIHKTFNQSAIYSYTYSDYIESDGTETIDIQENDIIEFFGLSGRLQEAVDNGAVKRVILWCTTNGNEWKETSVTSPRLPEGYEFGASYRSNGNVIPQTSSFTTLYFVGAKSATQLIFQIDQESMSENDMYHAGIRYVMYDEELGDTYNYDVRIQVSYSNTIL